MSELLVGVDRSDESRRAVEFATERARELGDSLVVVHVIPWSPFSFNTPEDNEQRPARRAAEIAAATTQVTEPMAAVAREVGVSVDTLVQHGDPVDTLIEIARSRGSAQIVLGRTGDGRVRRAVFGSIPSQVVQHASVPVTVVP
ncbi:universal stress protein [Nocardioides sp.]|uniref:universal stress protein n=1 Tax=Nocardioides sp. TaxID=35761 RepID=UPI003567FBDD